MPWVKMARSEDPCLAAVMLLDNSCSALRLAACSGPVVFPAALAPKTRGSNPGGRGPRGVGWERGPECLRENIPPDA